MPETVTKVAPTKKAAPAPKAAKPADDKPKGKRTNFSALYPEDAALKLLVTENPKKEGSKSYARFQSYFKAKTVGEAMTGDTGVTYQDIVYDIGHGFIKVG
jgi:hypothetical protein